MRRLLSLLVPSLIAVSIPLVALAQTEELPGDCAIDEGTTVRVLLLIDQSGSLARTDPDDQRITGARAVVRSYASLAERVEQVEIQVAGFGEGFVTGEWVGLDQDTLGAVLEQVESVGSVNDQPHTDYVYALDGASEAFAGSSPADCQILFWFTDGEHDLDTDLLPAGGLERFYYPEGPVTPENADEAEALMPGLVCEQGGYADLLGGAGVSAQIMVLGDESGMDEASRRVLRGMGGDPAFDCGPGNGSFQSVDDAARLPFIMACASQVGSYELADLPVEDGRLVVTEQTVDAGPLPYQLATELRLITRGEGAAPELIPPALADFTETTDASSGTSAVVARPVGEPFTLEMTGVAEVCGFVTAVAATPVVSSSTPSLYQGEAGEFRVVADGPHGRIEGTALGRLQLGTDAGQVGTPDEQGWTIGVPALPSEPELELTVDLSSGRGLSASATAAFALNEQINAPAIITQPPPMSGEGLGPFLIDLQVDPRDGGEICLTTDSGSLTASDDGSTINVTAGLDGSDCVQVEAGGIRTVTLGLTLDRSGFAQGVVNLETRSTPSTRPDRSEVGNLAVDLEVTPPANPALVAVIVTGLMLLMLASLWGIVYGVNRLIGRIPDPRRNRVRYANFVAEISRTEYGEVRLGMVEMPVDSEFRIPQRTPSRLEAGRLSIARKVSPLPWAAPWAEIGAGADVVAAHQGPGIPGRTVVSERWYRGRARDALGPLVAIGVASSQVDRLAEGTAQKVPGVLLFDIREARGSDASRFAAGMIDESLDLIAAEISTRQIVEEMERTGEV
ncbi:MAG TPA: VWA domain-containing protein [Acidimicrobiia bacterium]